MLGRRASARAFLRFDADVPRTYTSARSVVLSYAFNRKCSVRLVVCSRSYVFNRIHAFLLIRLYAFDFTSPTRSTVHVRPVRSYLFGHTDRQLVSKHMCTNRKKWVNLRRSLCSCKRALPLENGAGRRQKRAERGLQASRRSLCRDLGILSVIG